MSLDLYIFDLVNQLAGQWYWLDIIAIFFAKYFEYILLSSLILFLIYPLKPSKLGISPKAKFFNRAGWQIVAESLAAAFISRFVMAEIISRTWFRPRPFVENSVNLLLPGYSPQEPSFPSGHASFYFALATVIYCYDRRIGTLFYIAGFVISISRIFVGVHWPSDVLAGALLGIAVGFLSIKLRGRKYI